MKPEEAQEELEEVQSDLRRREEEVTLLITNFFSPHHRVREKIVNLILDVRCFCRENSWNATLETPSPVARAQPLVVRLVRRLTRGWCSQESSFKLSP